MKFDVVARFRETIPTVKSVFFIRDLEKFQIFDRNNIFTFFQKIKIFWGLTGEDQHIASQDEKASTSHEPSIRSLASSTAVRMQLI